MKVNVIVETGKDSFSCFVSESEKLSIGIHGSGKTVKDAMDDFRIAYEEAKAYVESKGEEFTELEFDFVFDVGAFFNYYPINTTAFAKYVGMNASLLRQYCSGVKSPKGDTIRKIKDGIDALLFDISSGHLIDRPVLQYVN